MNEAILSKGALVHVTSYGPFFGRTGTIRAVDIIGEESPSPIPFYLVVLQDEPRKELWLEQDAVAEVVGDKALIDALPSQR